MFTLTIDEWDGVFCKSAEFFLSERDDYLKFVKQLDGSKHTCLSIVEDIDEDAVVLFIGGGGKEFVVTKDLSNVNFWSLINPNPASAGSISVCVGGQFGDYESRKVVGFDLAVKALKEFFSGKTDRDLIWEVDE